MITLDEVRSRLKGMRRCAGQWIAHCPAHNDHTPSLSIRLGDRGKVLFKCFAGCTYERITDALGGRPSDAGQEGSSGENDRAGSTRETIA